MEVNRINPDENISNLEQKIQVNKTVNIQTTPISSNESDEKIRATVDYIQNLKNKTPDSVNYQELKKLIEEISPKLENVGIFLSFDKIGNIPIVRVKDVTGKIIKVFPKEEMAELMRRIRLFFDVLTELLLNKKV
ncbi:MAG: flagellar protein FlaG [Candidatus Calescibacterium sp.]|nr:flagellar protein FlaG [Candidatus Calescibacterium sp.]